MCAPSFSCQVHVNGICRGAHDIAVHAGSLEDLGGLRGWEAQVARLPGGRLCVAPSSRSAASTRDLPLGRQAFAFSLASNTSRKSRGCLRWTPSTSWEAEGDHPVELPLRYND